MASILFRTAQGAVGKYNSINEYVYMPRHCLTQPEIMITNGVLLSAIMKPILELKYYNVDSDHAG